MTIQEIKDAITFKIVEGQYFLVLKARLEVHAKCNILHEHAKQSEVIEHMKEDMRHLILCELFEDRRKEMAAALYELLRLNPATSPLNMGEFIAVQDRILEAAKFSRDDIKTLTGREKTALD